MPKQNNPTSVRLSDEANHLWGNIAVHLGLSKQSVLELAIRKLARSEGIPEQAHSREDAPESAAELRRLADHVIRIMRALENDGEISETERQSLIEHAEDVQKEKQAAGE